MIDWPKWQVSSLSPIIVVENLPDGMVRDIAHFPIAGNGLLRSPEGEEAAAQTCLAAAAPALAKALEAACYALRSYATGTNSSTELAVEIADAGATILKAAGADRWA